MKRLCTNCKLIDMRLKIFLVSFILLFHCSIVYGKSDIDSLFRELNKAIDKAQIYDAQKLKQIESIKKSLGLVGNSQLTAQYDFYLKLYEAYKIFKFDSAFTYAKKLEGIASALNDPSKVAHSRNKLFFVLLSAGMFKEASDITNQISIKGQPDSIKADYYSLLARYYYDLADYSNDQFHTPEYLKIGNQYLDSALALFPVRSFESIYFNGLKSLKTERWEKASSYFRSLLNRQDITDHQLALVYSTLSHIYLRGGERQTAVSHLIRAAIADIRSSTKETFATFNLAQTLFEQGDFEKAYTLIEKAIEDASFYGARQRKVQVSEILPIIQSTKISYIEKQRKTWIIYGAVATFILVVLVYLVIVITRQYNKLKKADRIISEAHNDLRAANDKLNDMNAHLQQVNSQLFEVNNKLLEANKIKEEYMGYFFNINSSFFQKIERFKKAIELKVADRKLEEIKVLIHNIDIKSEREDLLKSFDRVFLKLFPNFVEEFNALFHEDDQIELKEDELLNTELRIYALMRMGITESEKIAQILEYSIKTIYAYKTKIRNKTKVPKEEFDKRVMSITSL
jgi:tetratricopeptide (TPR) repeat protein